jgi:hypothetical protein
VDATVVLANGLVSPVEAGFAEATRDAEGTDGVVLEIGLVVAVAVAVVLVFMAGFEAAAVSREVDASAVLVAAGLTVDEAVADVVVVVVRLTVGFAAKLEAAGFGAGFEVRDETGRVGAAVVLLVVDAVSLDDDVAVTADLGAVFADAAAVVTAGRAAGLVAAAVGAVRETVFDATFGAAFGSGFAATRAAGEDLTAVFDAAVSVADLVVFIAKSLTSVTSDSICDSVFSLIEAAAAIGDETSAGTGDSVIGMIVVVVVVVVIFEEAVGSMNEGIGKLLSESK